MAIGNNDIDYDGQSTSTQQGGSGGDQYIDSFLREQGINDKSRIKFEDGMGGIQEVNWNDLTDNEKLNVLNTTIASNLDETQLDNDEIQMINNVRQSGLRPEEYLQAVANNGADRYAQAMQQNMRSAFTTDQYTDDELYVADFMSRTPDVSEDEAREQLEQAKSNPDLFNKQISAIRKEYQTIEAENIQNYNIQREAQAQAQYQEFTRNVVDQINDFTDFSGYDLNMEDEDKQLLYDFVTGYDAAGVNHFAKALSDPKTMVRTAWFALNGGKMIEDITKYYNKEIGRVRNYSYQKGLADARAGQQRVIYKNKSNQSSNGSYSDLDDY